MEARMKQLISTMERERQQLLQQAQELRIRADQMQQSINAIRGAVRVKRNKWIPDNE